MTLYYSDDTVTLHHGDALAVLRELPAGSVDCCVTSPPYFGLRDYGTEGQYGLEVSPAEYVARMAGVFGEVRRVLADDGTLWLNCDDTYSARQRGSDEGWEKSRLSNPGGVQKRQFASLRECRHTAFDRPYKNLLGIPWRVAFALQDDGWVLRNEVVWAKPNAMPESVTDRLSTRHEKLFLFSKARRYWFDLDPIRETFTPQPGLASSFAKDTKEATVPGQSYRQHRPSRADPVGRQEATPPGMNPQSNLGPTGERHSRSHPQGKNPGDVWSIPTQPFVDAHFAVMPVALAERCVQAGCKPGGVVLDPFSGSGTTGLAATKHGRRYVGIDLNAEYLALSLRTRLAQAGLDFGEVAG